MKIVVNSLIPFPGYKAMNLFGILFVRKDEQHTVTDITINHEKIHTAQIREMLYIFFYIWYVIEWFIKVFIYLEFHEAYRNLAFEREAYENQDNLNYLNSRKHYNWIKKIWKRKN